MRRALTLHPDSLCNAVRTFEVEVRRLGQDRLELTYLVSGRIADLALPDFAAPRRADELWKQTCFEAFLRPEAGEAYFEFNLAPSGLWATYAFTNYREGMTAPAGAPGPSMTMSCGEDRLRLEARLRLGGLPGLSGQACRLGVSAVIEERGGRKSYWALTHPPGKADFHHADGFAVALQL
jgi:hypothetical protein